MTKKITYIVVAFIFIGYATAFIFNHINPWIGIGFIIGASFYAGNNIEKYFNNQSANQKKKNEEGN